MESHLSLAGMGNPAGNECPVIRDIQAGAERSLVRREWSKPVGERRLTPRVPSSVKRRLLAKVHGLSSQRG